VLLIGWSFLEGVGAALIMPAIGAAGRHQLRRSRAFERIRLVAAAGAVEVGMVLPSCCQIRAAIAQLVESALEQSLQQAISHGAVTDVNSQNQ